MHAKRPGNEVHVTPHQPGGLAGRKPVARINSKVAHHRRSFGETEAFTAAMNLRASAGVQTLILDGSAVTRAILDTDTDT